MKRLSVLLFFVQFLIFKVNSQQLPQQWIRTFQAQGKAQDRVAAITTDASGNIYIAGFAGGHHAELDAFAMKRNPQGDTLWTYYYDSGTHDRDYATAIVVDNAGNTYITGQSEDTPSRNECFTAKISPSGTEDWVTRYSPGGNVTSKGNALIVDATGNVYVAGFSHPPSAGQDWLVIKYNAAGVQEWVDLLNGPGNSDDEAFDIALAPNGNPTVCGYTFINSSASYDAFVKQYTPTNGTTWTATWSNPSFAGIDKAHGIGFNAAGEAFIGGETKNATGTNQDAFAMKFDLNGIPVWTTIYTDAFTSTNELFLNGFVDPVGNVYLTGTDYQDGFITRINNDGSQGWRKKWRGPVSNGLDVFNSVAVDNAGNTYVSGRGVFPGPDYYAINGKSNLIITKYNSTGDSLWTYRTADTLRSSMSSAITVRDGKVYAGGFLTDSAFVDENIYTVVIDTAGNAVSEWSYNGRGDAITNGQFVKTDASNNVYCGANIDRLHGYGKDVAIVKYSPTGTQLWERYYSSYGWNNDTLTGMLFDPSGNLILCVSTDSAMSKTKYQLSLLKMDPNGTFLDTSWLSLAGSTIARSMVVRQDGSIALTASSGLGGIVVSFDAALNHAWTALIDSTALAVTRANSIDVFPNGDVAVGGFSQSSTAVIGLVQRYSVSGSKLWSATIDSVAVYDEVRDVTVGASGDVAFTGASGGNTTYGARIGRVNGVTGAVNWTKFYNPSTNNEYGVKVRFTPSGNIVFIARGWTGFVARYYTVQYDGSGFFQWNTTYSMTASDREPVDLIVEPSNRVVTAGWEINGFIPNYNYVLAGYGNSGIVAFTNTYTNTQTPSLNWDQLYDLERDSQGDFVVTGRSAQELYNEYLYKMVTIKYGSAPVGLGELSDSHTNVVTVFPNPSHDGRFVLLDGAPDPLVSGHVYDVTGRLISELDLNTFEIDLSGHKSGLYVLVLKRKNGSMENVRLLVE